MERISKATAAVMFPAQVKVYRVMIEMCEVLKDMASEWDGKAINKRFITAFEKRFPKERGRLNINRDGAHPRFSFYVEEGRCVKGGGYVSDYTSRIEYGNKPYIPHESLRLNVELLNIAIDTNIELFKMAIYNYEYCLEHYDEIKEQTRRLSAQVRAFYNRIPYPLKPSTSYIDSPFGKF